MTNATHPLVEIDRDTLTALLDALKSEAGNASAFSADLDKVGDALTIMQDIINRAVDVRSTIVQAVTQTTTTSDSHALANQIEEIQDATDRVMDVLDRL